MWDNARVVAAEDQTYHRMDEILWQHLSSVRAAHNSFQFTWLNLLGWPSLFGQSNAQE